MLEKGQHDRVCWKRIAWYNVLEKDSVVNCGGK